MRTLGAVACLALLLPSIPAVAAQGPPNFICDEHVVVTPAVTVIIVTNRPGPPGPATCEPSVTVCHDTDCRTVAPRSALP